MTSVLIPVRYDAPLVNPSPNGLFPVTNWTDQDEPLRWLPGVDVRVYNYAPDGFGVWAAEWDAVTADLTGDDVKTGVRPEFPDTFVALTTYGYDDGAFPGWSQAEVRTRAQQAHRLLEPNATETALAARMLTDAGTPGTATDIVGAVGQLEALLAQTDTLGFIHASAAWAAKAAQAFLIVRSGSTLKTPLGHTWVFGGGYVGVDGLDDTLVATSPTFGYRGPVAVRDTFKLEFNRYSAIAERSLLVGYEALVGAVTIT